MVEPESGALKGTSDKELPEHLKACKNGKCIAELMLLAKTEFEKQVCIEFVNIEKYIAESFAKIKTELKLLKYLVVALIGATIILKLIGG